MKLVDRIMNNRSLVVLIVLICFFVQRGVAQQISPMLVGNNAWFTNPTDQVWALTGACGVKTIRIGGNAFNDNMPSNETLLGWVKKIRAIGAEPIIQVSQHQSAEVAASIVRFLNIDKAGEIAPVKYWNIGNEPWLEANRPATSTIGPMVEAYFKPISAAMKAVDPTIKIFGFDEAYYMEDAIDALFGGANDIAGKIPGKEYYYCDGISWHRYPQDENINLAYEGIEDFKTSIVKCKQKVDAINLAYNRTGDNALQWGIGEYNAKGGPQVHTWENGQMFGGVLGLCMKYGATYAATWSMFENGGSRTGTDFSFIDGTNMTPRSSYRHMQFVAQHFTGNYIDGKTSNSHIIIYGAQNGNKTSVMIMNRNSGAPLKYTLHLNEAATSGANVVLNVNGGIDKTYSDIIGERTTQVLIFEGEAITKINYSDIHFKNEQAPVETSLGSVTEPPVAPLNLQEVEKSYKQIQIGWEDNSTNESGFIIERLTAGTFQVIAIVDANITSYTDVGLTAETTYEYRVLAYNGLGESAYTNVASIMTDVVPGPLAFNGPHQIPGKIEAEDYNDNDQDIGYNDSEIANRGGQYRMDQGVDIESCTDTNGGFNVGYISNGEWLNYQIENVTEGKYKFGMRLASNTDGIKKVTVSLDNVVMGTIIPANTGGWQNWETRYINDINLAAATNKTLRLTFEGSGFNINWFEFAPSVVTSFEHDRNSKINYYYNSQLNYVYVELDHPSKKFSLDVFDLSGRRYLSLQRENFLKDELYLRPLPKGIYIIRAQADQGKIRAKIAVF